jgi:hypothetical protein
MAIVYMVIKQQSWILWVLAMITPPEYSAKLFCSSMPGTLVWYTIPLLAIKVLKSLPKDILLLEKIILTLYPHYY